ncbi:MAG: TIM barrel protein [Xenococcus sp. (in: cyanobacteria)]
MLKRINRCLIALVMVILLGITTAVPANAAPHPPIFDNVRLGITPTGWSNSDDLSMDLDPPIPYQQIMSEIALSGYEGTQNAPKFPDDIEDLKKYLGIRGLTISEPWVGTNFTTPPLSDNQQIFEDQMEFMGNFDSNVIVVAELGGAVHQIEDADPIADRPIFTNDQWTQLIDGLNSLGDQAFANDFLLCYHPHVGTGVMTKAEIDRLMEGTKDHHLSLLIDTGHLYYGGASQQDILDLIDTYGSRIKHVHLKNIRQEIFEDAIENGLSFFDAISAGIFTVPGDTAGVINFDNILHKLAWVNYEGWLMVEAEQDPRNTTIQPVREPLEYALMARDYLYKVTGL